jgi:hypothetical protein
MTDKLCIRVLSIAIGPGFMITGFVWLTILGVI